jgi:hypothetical protein
MDACGDDFYSLGYTIRRFTFTGKSVGANKECSVLTGI